MSKTKCPYCGAWRHQKVSKPHGLLKIDPSELGRLLESGLRVPEIAAKLGVTRQTVYSTMKREGLRLFGRAKIAGK